MTSIRIFSAWLCLPAFALATTAVAGEDSLFRDRVAPILERRCVSCHGESTAKGKLSLATEASTRKGGDGGPAVVSGQPDESLIFEKISGDKPEMPKSGPPLTKAEIETVRNWIATGATWPKGLVLRDRRFEGERWWAFEPLTSPAVPTVSKSDTARIRNPIDAFVLKALAEHGLTPSPEADRRTLFRRLSFDLLGLPPDPAEVDAFVADNAPDAYEKVVDRMLASPRYGERWARHWLDIVHYGDTHGYDKDKRRENAWPYRDYVIDALNRDLPYGEFVRQQVAGDLLDPNNPRGLIATGFVAAGPWDFVGHVELREGTVDKEKTRLIDRDDMVMNTIGTFNSLTVHCARCHDHKFDPIPQRDYYRLQAVFAGVDRGDRRYLDPDAQKRVQELEKKLADRKTRRAGIEQAALTRLGGDVQSRFAAIERLQAEIARLSAKASRSTSDADRSPSNGYHSSVAVVQDVTKWVQVDLGRSLAIDDVRLIPARPVDFPDTPGFGFPARMKVEISDDPKFETARRIDRAPAGDLVNPREQTVVIEANGAKGRYVRVTATRLWPRTSDYVFALSELQVLSGGRNVATGATVTSLDSIESGRWGRTRLVDGFDSRAKLADLNDPLSIRAEQARREIRTIENERAAKVEAALTPAERAEIVSLDRQIQAIDAERQSTATDRTSYALISHPSRPIHVLKRGDVEQKGEAVEPGTLSCVPGVPFALPDAARDQEGARRLALANWLADTRNPLTWRSIVNRVWQYHFGRGIVDTPNDFGRNGSKPTHPELLDYLATEFLKGGQSLKRLHRLIVTSATYRQTSADRPDGSAIDAENRFLWRMNRRRLEAEAVRDSVLAVSGTLDLRMGGPGFPLFRFKDDHSPIYDHLDRNAINAPVGHRRAIYRFIVRSVSNPFLDCLDAVDPNINTPTRTTTVTALQSLALWNDPFMLAQAEAFAKRVLSNLEVKPGSNPAELQSAAAFRLALARAPRADEQAALTQHTARHGLAATCRLLLNTNEFLFVD